VSRGAFEDSAGRRIDRETITAVGDAECRTALGSRATVGAFVRRPKQSPADRQLAARRIDRCEEAFAHLQWSVAYSALAHSGRVAGFAAVRRWVDDLESLTDGDIVDLVLGGVA
jgi:hypothetical protein